MENRHNVPVIKVAIRGANGRMGLQAIYASVENNDSILKRSAEGSLKSDDVWIDIVFGAFTADIPTVQQLLAGVLRSEKSKILEGYDKNGHPVFRTKADGKFELRTRYVEQKLDEEPQRRHIIPFARQEIVETEEGLPAIRILSSDRNTELLTIRHVNVRFGELSAEAIMDRVLDLSSDLGANVLLSCVGDTAKKADSMKKWLTKCHEKDYALAFVESAPAKGWEKRLFSKQYTISVLCTRNYSPTGTLFRTGLTLKRPLFDFKKYEFSKASRKFSSLFKRITEIISSNEMFSSYVKFMPSQPQTIKEVEGETVLVNFPPEFMNVSTPDYIKFSFYEDNEYGFVYGAMLPNVKAAGLVYRDREFVNEVRKKGVKFEAITNIPGIFGTDWFVKAPQEIISRGGAISTSSCTTNGNVVADFIILMALMSYHDLFLPEINGYFLSDHSDEEREYEIKINVLLEKFEKEYLPLLCKSRARLIRSVLGFYYNDIQFMDTDMQHGLTRSESPDIIEFLRETTSGSQTEVPRILSMSDKEVSYFRGLKSKIKKDMARETDSATVEKYAGEIENLNATLKTIEHSIDILEIMEKTRAC
jgi:hypothetical protein